MVTTLAVRAVRKFRRIALRKTAVLRSPLRAAIIGFGQIAPFHAVGYEESGIARLVAVNDVNPLALGLALDRLPHIRAYKDLSTMLREQRPDIVSVCTWPQDHAETVAMLAEAGVRGILCEKPLALTLADVERMVSACREHGVKLAGGHQYRFHPRFTRAAELVRAGELGEITSAYGCIGSTIANNGPHLIDTVRFVLGDPRPLSVSCNCRRTRDEWNRGYPAEDCATGSIRFAGDIVCRFETGDLAKEFFAIHVTGSRGTLEITPKRLVVNGRVAADAVVEEREWRAPQFRGFIDWVKGAKQHYAADADSSAETVQILLALYESARLDSTIQLPLENKGNVISQLYPGDDGPSPQVGGIQPAAVATRSLNGQRLASEGGQRAAAKWFSTNPAVGLAELSGLARVVLSKNMSCTGGTVVKTLEGEFAAAYGSPAAVASTSGTAAIHVALGAINPEPGEEIITTPLTDMGTIIPILAANCIPVFADVDPLTGNLTAEAIKAKLTPKTRAVILVHLFGRPADLGPIADLLRERNVALIEDCCQAHYAEYNGKKVGTFGDFGCFSLQQSKQITCGDGGITLINRPDRMTRAALFVDKGWDRNLGLRAHLFLGMNYRMTELQGSVALAQLKKLPRLIASRREMAGELTQKLAGIPHVIPPSVPKTGALSSWWVYPFSIDSVSSGIDIDVFQGELVAEGIRVRREYVAQPVFTYPVLKERKTYGESGYPFPASYVPPCIDDYPGFRGFNSRLLYIGWSHSITGRNVTEISSGVAKVIDALSTRP